jgi:hypothetical protein
MRPSSSLLRVLSLLTFGWALAGAAASAQDVFHLREGGLLVPDAPAAGSSTAVLSTAVANGENKLLATFTSAELPQDLNFNEARAVLFLGTGRPGMDGCARVTTSIARLAGASHTEVATGELVTTIRPRRKVIDPIVVPMAVTDSLLAAAGDRIVLQIRVANECGGERNVSVMYDSAGRASRIELVVAAATTTTTTTIATPSTVTTTTLPATCLDVATGLAAVRCRLEMMDALVRSTSPAKLGGPRFVRRLARRLERALTLVRASELIEATPRRLRRTRRHMMRFAAQLDRGQADGRVAPEVGASLDVLSSSAIAGLSSLLVAK